MPSLTASRCTASASRRPNITSSAKAGDSHRVWRLDGSWPDDPEGDRDGQAQPGDHRPGGRLGLGHVAKQPAASRAFLDAPNPVHAGELVVEPHLQILRRHRRPLLLRLEHAHRSAVENMSIASRDWAVAVTHCEGWY